MAVLKRDEVHALGKLYFHWESGRAGPNYCEMLSCLNAHVTKDMAGPSLTSLLDKGLILLEGEGDLERRPVRITTEGIEWFERNVDYWRDCNQFRVRPLFDDPVEPAASKSLGERLRDPLVPGAAIFGAVAAMLLTRWFF